MSKYEAVTANARVVANHYRRRGINECQLLDLTVTTNDEARIWKLQSTYEHLLVNLRIFAYINVRCIQKRHGADLNVGAYANLLSPYNREEADGGVIADVHSLAADHGAETDRDALAYPIAFEAVKDDLHKARPEAVQ